jgi:uncharacterized membrane protein YdjX (TVP38/TMEM64 family)
MGSADAPEHERRRQGAAVTVARGLKVAAVAIALAGVVALGWLLPVADWVIALADRVRGAGAAGVLLFTAAYVIATVALLPGSVLTLAAGFAYGPVVGLLVTSPASVLAATAAFLLGRTTLRGWVQRRIANAPRTQALSRAIGKDSFKLILLLRLSPVVPFTVLNYALGLSEASLGRYVLASFIGMLPGTWMYVYLGSLATTAASLSDAGRGGGPTRVALSGAGLAATVLAVVFVTRSARNALRRELKTEEPS